MYKFLLIAFMLSAFSGRAQNNKSPQNIDLDLITDINIFVNDNINSAIFNKTTGYYKKDSIQVDSCIIDNKKELIHIYFDAHFAYAPFREETIENLKKSLLLSINNDYSSFKIYFYSNGINITNYIPNYYITRKKTIDKNKTWGKLRRKTAPIVQNISHQQYQELNLHAINIALWHSHGWYYEPSLERWEWQRARLMNTVEDLYTMSYTMNYILPMLENAGANVFLPRERDWQIHEVIVDNDQSTGQSIFKTNLEFTLIDTGFLMTTAPITTENPFKLGTAIKTFSEKKKAETIEWIPEIPADGFYPVYVSYISLENSVDAAHYKVYHSGGVTEFLVNQQIGGGTWIYLGKFKFKKGINNQLGKVALLNTYKKNKQIITADAVRFGGGMGTIERNGLLSKRPRYQEAARYYLQYAGFPDSLVWKIDKENEDDYKDDLRSRGEWVNYLMGNSLNLKDKKNGLGIPIDLSLAFHTDAGITDNDTVIGTLGIYSTRENEPSFPSGISKMASRDLTDIIQTQIVDDIRKKYDPAWTRRGLWDKGYSEAHRGEVPTMLLELLSHQNFLDSRFGKEPTFQFDVSRAIYKGMLKFLNAMYDITYIVQPLPITHFQTELTKHSSVILKWQAQIDPLEPTALPDEYLVYTKLNNGGFDNGTLVRANEFELANILNDTIYTFKITALNKGGESFPSEELSICNSSNAKDTVLIINAFDRLGGPAWFNDEKHAGFLDNVDQGVPYMYDFHTTGAQYDFDKNSPWLDDDSPGFGASYADLEDQIIPGNTFNFSYIHGKSIKNAGYSFVSVSDEAVSASFINIAKYKIVDFLAGEEKTTYMPKNDTVPHFQIYTVNMVEQLKKYLNNGGNIFISGAHIASDAHANKQDSLLAVLLKFKWRTSNASKKGDFYVTNTPFGNTDSSYRFNTKINSTLYTVEGADALEPADTDATTFLRYTENNMSAGVSYSGLYNSISIGFPFETIIDEGERNDLMIKILNYLNKEK